MGAKCLLRKALVDAVYGLRSAVQFAESKGVEVGVDYDELEHLLCKILIAQGVKDPE